MVLQQDTQNLSPFTFISIVWFIFIRPAFSELTTLISDFQFLFFICLCGQVVILVQYLPFFLSFKAIVLPLQDLGVLGKFLQLFFQGKDCEGIVMHFYFHFYSCFDFYFSLFWSTHQHCVISILLDFIDLFHLAAHNFNCKLFPQTLLQNHHKFLSYFLTDKSNFSILSLPLLVT